MKNGKCSKNNAKNQILKHFKIMCYIAITMPFCGCLKLFFKAFKLSQVQYNGKMVEVLSKSIDSYFMIFELFCACFALYILLKIYEFENK